MGKNGLKVIDDNGTLCLNEKYIEEKLSLVNLPVITNKYGTEYKKRRFEFVDQLNNQPSRRFLRSDLLIFILVLMVNSTIELHLESHGKNLISYYVSVKLHLH